MIKTDLFAKGRIRVKDYVDFVAMGKKFPEVKWMLKYCDVTASLFTVAMFNIYNDIPIFLDPVKYSREIQSKIPNCPNYYPVLKEYDDAIAEVRRWEDYLIKKGEITENERFKEEEI